MPQPPKVADTPEWHSDLRRMRAFWFGSRGFRPKLMRGGPILGWPESPQKPATRKSLKKSDKMVSRY